MNSEITFTTEIHDEELVEKLKKMMAQKELARENWLYSQDKIHHFVN